MSGTQRRRNEGAAEERREKEGKIDGKEKEDKGGGKGNSRKSVTWSAVPYAPLLVS